MAYRILTFDGGGVRGVYTAVLLDRLAGALPGLLAATDLFAGTSTGGIIALGLAKGLVPAQLVTLYQTKAKEIFDASWLHDLAELDGLTGAHFDNEKLKGILAEIFSNTRLDQLAKKVLVPSFQLDNRDPQAGKRRWKPKFFHNFAGPDSDGSELALDVALRTSAAPTYFPTYQGYIDGGVVANDPSMAALAQALDHSTGGQRLDNVRLYSLGTGTNPTYIAGRDLDWGVAQWAKPLVSLMIDGVMGVAEYQCRRLLGEGAYRRIEPLLPKPIALDDVDAVTDLVEYAKNVPLEPEIEWLRANFL